MKRQSWPEPPRSSPIITDRIHNILSFYKRGIAHGMRGFLRQNVYPHLASGHVSSDGSRLLDWMRTLSPTTPA